jgi:hypothetical protein
MYAPPASGTPSSALLIPLLALSVPLTALLIPGGRAGGRTMYAPSTASGAQWMMRITCLHASGYLRHGVPLWSMEPIVGGRRMPQAADGADEGADGASKGTNEAVKGTDNASKGTYNAIQAPRFASYRVPG